MLRAGVVAGLGGLLFVPPMTAEAQVTDLSGRYTGISESQAGGQYCPSDPTFDQMVDPLVVEVSGSAIQLSATMHVAHPEGDTNESATLSGSLASDDSFTASTRDADGSGERIDGQFTTSGSEIRLSGRRSETILVDGSPQPGCVYSFSAHMSAPAEGTTETSAAAESGATSTAPEGGATSTGPEGGTTGTRSSGSAVPWIMGGLATVGAVAGARRLYRWAQSPTEPTGTFPADAPDAAAPDDASASFRSGDACVRMAAYGHQIAQAAAKRQQLEAQILAEFEELQHQAASLIELRSAVLLLVIQSAGLYVSAVAFSLAQLALMLTALVYGAKVVGNKVLAWRKLPIPGCLQEPEAAAAVVAAIEKSAAGIEGAVATFVKERVTLPAGVPTPKPSADPLAKEILRKIAEYSDGAVDQFNAAAVAFNDEARRWRERRQNDLDAATAVIKDRIENYNATAPSCDESPTLGPDQGGTVPEVMTVYALTWRLNLKLSYK